MLIVLRCLVIQYSFCFLKSWKIFGSNKLQPISSRNAEQQIYAYWRIVLPLRWEQRWRFTEVGASKIHICQLHIVTKSYNNRFGCFFSSKFILLIDIFRFFNFFLRISEVHRQLFDSNLFLKFIENQLVLIPLLI